MAKVLSSFLIAIGADTREWEKGQKEVERGLVNIRSTALASSAALVGVFGAAASVAGGVQKMNVATQGMRASVADIETFGAALRAVGGNSEKALSDLQALDKMAAQMRMGQFDATGLAKAGVTGDEIARLRDAQGPMEQMRILADIVPRLKPMQRGMLTAELGISDESMKLLAKGQQDYNRALAEAQKAINISVMPELIEQSAQFTEQMGKLQNTLVGMGNTMTNAVLPSMNAFLGNLDTLATQAAPYAEQAAEKLVENKDSLAMILAGALGAKAGLKLIGGGAVVTGAAQLSDPAGKAVADEIIKTEVWGDLREWVKSWLPEAPVLNQEELSKPWIGGGSNPTYRGDLSQYGDGKTSLYDDIKASAYAQAAETQAQVESSRTPERIDYKRLGAEVAASMRGVELNNNVTVQLDGQVIGATVENHMDRSNTQMMESFTGGMAR